MHNPIKFGTDGWRGVIAREFTFDNVRVCARAVAEYLHGENLASQGLVIGYDTRFASEDFAAAAAEVVAAGGIKVYLCPTAAPTPVISYGTMANKAGGAIIITASHNPGAWNGFKYKSDDGASAPDEVTESIEKNVNRIFGTKEPECIPLGQALDKGLVEYLDLEPVYTEQVSKLVDLDNLKKSGVKIVIDTMYGAGSGYLKRLLGGGNMDIIEINGERNPLFPGMQQPEPIAHNLTGLSAAVIEHKADVGIASDGDADRVGIIDENGVFVSTLHVFALLSLYLLEVRGERGLIARSLNTSVMLDSLGKEFGVEVRETPIGFKFLAPALSEENAMIAGEESGGYGFRGHVAERDGILAALYFLDLMAKTGKTPSQLVDYLHGKTGTHSYNRVDMHYPAEKRAEIIGRVKNGPSEINGIKVADIDTTDGYKYKLVDGSWLLIRFSGTEPLLRTYAESSTPEEVERLLTAAREIAGV